MNLILPIGGQSTRFSNLRPKWMLNHPNGNLMLYEAIQGIDLNAFEKILIISILEHEKQYCVKDIIKSQFSHESYYSKIELVIIDSTISQPETVYKGLVNSSIDLSKSILIKDSDNYFKVDLNLIKGKNAICYGIIGKDFNNGDIVNKSYVLMNDENVIINIVEKKVISNSFCVGGYCFKSANDFIHNYQKICDVENLYVSHVIHYMICNGTPFIGINISHYLDWGTIKDWEDYKTNYATLFIDIDGVLVKNSAEYFKPYWGTTEGIQDNINYVNNLYDSNCIEIILVTSRKESYEEITIKQLKAAGIKYHRIIFGLYHAKRIIVNDYCLSNAYRTCDAINIHRNSSELPLMLRGILK